MALAQRLDRALIPDDHVSLLSRAQPMDPAGVGLNWSHVLESAFGTGLAMIGYQLVRKAAAALTWAAMQRRMNGRQQTRA